MARTKNGEYYPDWMDSFPWRGDGRETCLLCGDKLNGREFKCATCDAKIVRTMLNDIVAIVDGNG